MKPIKIWLLSAGPIVPPSIFPELGLTCATLAVTAAIIKTEKIHNVLWWEREGVKTILSPERGVGGETLPAVLLDPVQVEPGVPSVSGVLNYKTLTTNIFSFTSNTHDEIFLICNPRW